MRSDREAPAALALFDRTRIGRESHGPEDLPSRFVIDSPTELRGEDFITGPSEVRSVPAGRGRRICRVGVALSSLHPWEQQPGRTDVSLCNGTPVTIPGGRFSISYPHNCPEYEAVAEQR